MEILGAIYPSLTHAKIKHSVNLKVKPFVYHRGFVTLVCVALFVFDVSRVTGVSEGCRIKLILVIAEITQADEKTEIKCVTENKGGKREAVIQLQLEGEPSHISTFQLSVQQNL